MTTAGPLALRASKIKYSCEMRAGNYCGGLITQTCNAFGERTTMLRSGTAAAAATATATGGAGADAAAAAATVGATVAVAAAAAAAAASRKESFALFLFARNTAVLVVKCAAFCEAFEAKWFASVRIQDAPRGFTV